MNTPTVRYQAGDLHFLKRLNRIAVLDAVRREGGLSRADIAARAGLTKVTVGAVVQELLDQGWLAEGELQQGGSGRPGRQLHLNETRHALIGAEVGVRGLRVVACTLGGHVIHQHEERTTAHSPEAVAGQLAAAIHALLDQPDVAGRELVGLGVAVPGPVAPGQPIVLSAPNLGWRDVPFLELLRPHLPELGGPWLLDNEAKAAAFGELYFHPDGAPGTLAYLSVGTGIGCGVVGGNPTPVILRGAHGLGGEIGHTVIQPGGLYCHCGNRGCAETLASGWAVRAALGIPDDTPVADALLPRLAEPAVWLTLRKASEALGTLLLNLHHTINPDEIVIGGSLTRLGEPLLNPALEYFETHQNRLLGNTSKVRVRIRPDSTFTPARGAAAQVLANVIQQAGVTT